MSHATSGSVSVCGGIISMVAIDEDWSALRFRKAEYIKSLTVNRRASSSVGKKRTSAK